VHGDLKAVSTHKQTYFLEFHCTQANILIDKAGTAVLCDFGLSRIKADMTSRTTTQHNSDTLGTGSRNWMSPELLRGAAPRKPSDIYALGMTIYEVWQLVCHYLDLI
jgi:serine/threonine protein kinase